MAHSIMVKVFVSNNTKCKNENEKIVDAYNALDYIEEVLDMDVNTSFSSVMESVLPEIDSLIGALKALKTIKDENGSNPINEALKLF